MVAAAATGAFFSPLSGARLAPLEQQQLTAADMSPQSRRQRLEPPQQHSPWRPLAPLGREHSRSPVRPPSSGGSRQHSRSPAPVRPPCSDVGGRQQRDFEQPPRPPHRSPHMSPLRSMHRHTAADDSALQYDSPTAAPPPQRLQLSPHQGAEQPQRHQTPPPPPPPQSQQYRSPAAVQRQQQAPDPRHRQPHRQQQQPPQQRPQQQDLARASTDTVVLAERAAALGIHPLPTPPCSPAGSPPEALPEEQHQRVTGAIDF